MYNLICIENVQKSECRDKCYCVEMNEYFVLRPKQHNGALISILSALNLMHSLILSNRF